MKFDEIQKRMDQLKVDRSWLAVKCDYKLGTLAAILAPNGNLGHKTQKALRRIHEVLDAEEANQKNPATQLESQQIVLRPSDNQYDAWNRAALKNGLILRDWCMDTLIKAADSAKDAKIKVINVVPLVSADIPSNQPRKIAHLQAAAGDPILADVQDWDGEDDIVRVKINGLSMLPLLNDGDIIEMKHKRASRSQHVAKGKIYLFAYDGGFTVKRYNTRLATHAEIEAGISYISPASKAHKVRVLQSVNPDFPEIVLKDEAEWFAWLPIKSK